MTARTAREQLVATHEAGYRVVDGRVFSPSGRERALDLEPSGGGYYRFGVFFDGVGIRSVMVHRLVAYQKFGAAMFESGIEVRHLNNNSRDNSNDNIAIGTKAQNNADKSEWNRMAGAIAGGRAKRKLSDAQVDELRQRRVTGATYAELCAHFGITKCVVSYIVNGKTYK